MGRVLVSIIMATLGKDWYIRGQLTNRTVDFLLQHGALQLSIGKTFMVSVWLEVSFHALLPLFYAHSGAAQTLVYGTRRPKKSFNPLIQTPILGFFVCLFCASLYINISLRKVQDRHSRVSRRFPYTINFRS
jgi:hypothetical protein